MIEGDDAVHFGPGQVQPIGNDWQRVVRHMAELFLDAVEDRQQRTFEVLQFLDDRRRARCDLGTCRLHRHAAPSLVDSFYR
ncbi:hypothetical protein AJ88_42320 [Mesorhizobium amorphae CCBAU 01583]|nr:hypothetical protein AJ88_42320 [Mesorhizobium amorphae CCBAU 01583]